MKMKLIILMSLSAFLTGSVSMAAVDGSKPLVVIATVKVKPGTEEAFKAAAEEMLASARAEAGNISYTFVQGTADPTEFSTFEVWKSQDAIDNHMGLPFMKKFFSTVGNMFAPGFPILTTYQTFEKQ
ncbi:MAG: putative quinol monooxygenase [Pseudobdellovibrionaceae bacterium]